MDNKRNDKIWIFNTADTFTGNPKWLFIYINKYRKDIKAYWFCNSVETVKFVRKLGYKAYTYKSKRGKKIQDKTGVFVVEGVKEKFPVHLRGAKILNLWHGVGCKTIERKLHTGFLNERIAKKYIKYNTIYKNNQLLLVTSPLMEKHFKEQCGIDDDKILRGGYPRCMYNMYYDKISTYDHDILKQKGLSKDTKIAIYAPTYREQQPKDFMGRAIPDMDKLINKLKEKNMLLILKMHPFMEKDYNYLQFKEYYKDCPNLLFWDNSQDIYEIFYKIDLAIIDYSSIFYDMLAAGIPNFARYIFDYEDKENVRDFVFDLKEMTCGKICNSFEELINVFDCYEQQDEEDKKRIHDLFWSYTGKQSFEDIISSTLEFKIDDRELPELHSYDIFDTLIGRKTLKPKGIFYYVKEKMKSSNLNFPSYLVENYPRIRMESENNAREFYRKSTLIRKTDKIEIQFEKIFERMADVYPLTQEQIENLKNWELEAEYKNIIPLQDKISELKEHIENKDTVILISDMYLPKEFIKKLLIKADPILAELPLFVSSEYGVQKANKQLFLKVYEELEYNFSEWIHHGDNINSDGKQPRQLGIKVDIHKILKFNKYETRMVDFIGTYDAFLMARIMAEFRIEHEDVRERYAFSYVSLYWVTYVNFVIKDAIKRGIKCLYFVSRDGYHLKRIADKIIEMRNLPIKTKYIYGSRKAWRIPSFIDSVDEEFFSNFGNFSGTDDFKKVLKSLDIDEENFANIFPELSNYIGAKQISEEDKKKLITIFKNSEKYEKYLLSRAAERRKIIDEYLKQEIDFEEKFAFVEYWARGYTQDCLTRLIHNIVKQDIEVPFYYVRSIYPSIGKSIRYNFTTNISSLIFVEIIFANLPYESIERYEYSEDGKVSPVINKRKNDQNLHEALEKYLLEFCEKFCSMEFLDEDKLERDLLDFSLEWWKKKNFSDKNIYESIGSLKYTDTLYADEQEYAPRITMYDAFDSLRGNAVKYKTKSVEMSLARSTTFINDLYYGKKKIKKYVKKIKNSVKKIKKRIKMHKES